MPKVKNPNIAKTATKWGQTGSKTGSKKSKKSTQKL
jgi:hypothetical protein